MALVTIEYIDAKSHQFRTVNFGGFKTPTTREEAAAILDKAKVKYIKINGWK